MKQLSNDIVLRPRFQLELTEQMKDLLLNFEKSEVAPFVIKQLDEHIFIKFNKLNNHFWSPQLHLEIDIENNKLYGVFGPNPTLWTFFMFLHFGVALTFTIVGIWAYSSASLQKSYGFQLGLMGVIVALWFVLYLFGRMGKNMGKSQTEKLYDFLIGTLK